MTEVDELAESEDPRDSKTLFGGWLPRYQHIERLGHRAVQGILDDPAAVVIQEKLDGANVTIACSDPVARQGLVICSRNTLLYRDGETVNGFNGLVEYVLGSDDLMDFSRRGIIRAEWLVQHSIADYRRDAYRHLYVFDVQEYGTLDYVHPGEWLAWLGMGDAVKAVPTIEGVDPTPQGIAAASCDASHLGASRREGVVVKRYGGWRNCFGRVTWAKVVGVEFKERNGLHFTPRRVDGPEIAAASALMTREQVMKVIHKIADDHNGEVSVRNMAEILGRVTHEVVHEELIDWLEKKKVAEFNLREFKRLLTVKARDVALGYFNGVLP